MASITTGESADADRAVSAVTVAAVRIGDCLIRPALNRIERDGNVIRVQDLSMQVLMFLAGRAGSVVTYDEFLTALWTGRHAGEEAVHRRIAALRSHLGDDAKSPKYIETVPKRGYRLVAPVDWRPTTGAEPNRSAAPRLAAAAIVLVLVIAAGFLAYRWTAPSAVGSGAPYAAEIAVPKEVRIDLMSTPTAAEVAYRPYADPTAPWQPLGITPLRTMLPEGAWALRLMADGHETVRVAVTNPGIELNNVGADTYTIELPKAGSVPDGMVFIPESHQPVALWGFTRLRDVGEYFIARAEVTNTEYAEFVAAGGYRDPAYWEDLLASSDAFDFDELATRFSDSNGNPGPAGWIDGTYRPGTADLPVTGVSWYEAMAYARFRGLQLPAAPHWGRAALGVTELDRPFAPELLAVANIDGSGPWRADDERALSPSGAVNLIGNVAEWTRTFAGRERLSLGLSFRGQPWGYAMPSKADPLSRLPTQGFRLARYNEADYSSWNRPVAADVIEPRMPQVTDEVFAGILEQLRYDNGQIGADDAEFLSEIDEGNWVRRRILLPTSDSDEPLPVVMFIPRKPARPLQSLIYLTPGSRGPTAIHSDDIHLQRYQIEMLVESGRAIVWPILYGTHERYTGEIFSTPDPFEAGRLRRFEIKRHREEIGRTIDYLSASSEFDGERVGMLAASGGVVFIAPHLLAAESRFRAAVFLGGGVFPMDPEKQLLFTNPNTYWPRITLPVFLAHGRYDVAARFAPPETVGSTLYDVLGTPEPDKKLAVYEMAHWPFPPLILARDLLPWLDRYLGPVD